MHTSALMDDVQRVSLVTETDYDHSSPIEPFRPADVEPAPPEPEEPSDLDDLNWPAIDERDWEVFVADDDELDPLPDHRDFWVDRECE